MRTSGHTDPSTLLEGFRLLLQFLYEEEADYLCKAVAYERTTARVNSRCGHSNRNVRTPLGPVPVRIPHLKYFHPRPSMAKRAARLSADILRILERMHVTGATPEDASLLIETIWTAALSRHLLAVLTQRLLPALVEWRRQPAAPQAPRAVLDAAGTRSVTAAWETTGI